MNVGVIVSHFNPPFPDIHSTPVHTHTRLSTLCRTSIIYIADGSHCADMAASDTAHDTPTMLAARQQEEVTIAAWLLEARAERLAAGWV